MFWVPTENLPTGSQFLLEASLNPPISSKRLYPLLSYTGLLKPQLLWFSLSREQASCFLQEEVSCSALRLLNGILFPMQIFHISTHFFSPTSDDPNSCSTWTSFPCRLPQYRQLDFSFLHSKSAITFTLPKFC